jgi:hypothetical protein
MLNFAKLTAVCLMLAACADSGSLKPSVIVRGVDSGSRQVIDHYYTVEPDCGNAGYPEIHILRQPDHGVLSVENGETYPAFSKDNVRYECNKKKVASIQLSYASVAGFHGKDSFTIQVRFANSNLRLVS